MRPGPGSRTSIDDPSAGEEGDGCSSQNDGQEELKPQVFLFWTDFSVLLRGKGHHFPSLFQGPEIGAISDSPFSSRAMRSNLAKSRVAC